MNVEAFEQLIRVLREAPEEGFNLHLWHEEVNNSCGTVACAMGWAATDKWFNDQGLKLERVPGSGTAIPAARGELGVRAAMVIFDVPYDVAHDIFIPGLNYRAYHPSRADVIEKIKWHMGCPLAHRQGVLDRHTPVMHAAE